MIVARFVPSVLDSLWLSWWLVALVLRWRRRSSFFNGLIVFACFMLFVGLLAIVTARTSFAHADFMFPHLGAWRRSSVEVSLPRAAPIPAAQPVGLVPVAGTLGIAAQVSLSGASSLDANMPFMAAAWTLRRRAAGARPTRILPPPRVTKGSRLAA